MTEKLIKEAGDAVKNAEAILKEVKNFIEANIIKVDVKVTEGPLMKEARKLVADGLRNIAKAVEEPDKETKIVDIKKKK